MKPTRLIFLNLIVLFLLLAIDLHASDDKQLNAQLSKKGTQITLIKKTYYIDNVVNIPANKKVNGNGSKLIFKNELIKQWALTLNAGCSLSNLEIAGSNQSEEFNFVNNGAEAYRKFNFYYTPELLAVWLQGDKISLNNIKINGCKKGIGGNATNVSLNQLNVKGSYACIEMYISKFIRVTNSTFYGGSFGCITFPSCSDITVEKCMLYNPKSTGVNPGGASSEAMTPRNINVRYNTIIAGDCINLENGAIDVMISDNTIQCAPIVDKTINNSAIAVQVHDPKANSIIRNVTITRNHIVAYQDIMYGIGINIGNILGNKINQVVITNNTMSGGNEGIRVENKKNFVADQVTILNNNVICYAFGMRLFQVSNGTINNNTIRAYKSTWNDNLWGIQMHKCTNLTLNQNTTTGFMKHYYETEKSINVDIRKPNTQKGEVTKPYSVLFSDPSIPQTNNKIRLRND